MNRVHPVFAEGLYDIRLVRLVGNGTTVACQKAQRRGLTNLSSCSDRSVDFRNRDDPVHPHDMGYADLHQLLL